MTANHENPYASRDDTLDQTDFVHRSAWQVFRERHETKIWTYAGLTPAAALICQAVIEWQITAPLWLFISLKISVVVLVVAGPLFCITMIWTAPIDSPTSPQSQRQTSSQSRGGRIWGRVQHSIGVLLFFPLLYFFSAMLLGLLVALGYGAMVAWSELRS